MMEWLRIPEVKFAITTSCQAATLVQQVQAELVTPALIKGDKSPVTVADFAAQALVGGLLENAYPDDPLVGEEDASVLLAPAQSEMLAQITGFVRGQRPGVEPADVCRWINRGSAISGKRYWTVDPIDGTKGFLRGDQYVVALALVVDGAVQVGVLACPNLVEAQRTEVGGAGTLAVAVRGAGAWAAPLGGTLAAGEFTRLHASSTSDPTLARLLRSVETGHTNVDQLDELIVELGITAPPVKMDSQAKYVVLAAGAGDALLRLLSPEKPDYKEMIWDQAAGSLVIEEAGGRITDLHGRKLDFTAGRTLLHNRGILASNGLLHPSLLEGLAKIGL